MMSGPPCQDYSTACVSSDVQRLIPVARECGVSFHHYSIKNVVGYYAHLSGNVCLLRGAMFGLGVDRGRYFETSFPMHLDRPLAVGGARIRARTCLGGRRLDVGYGEGKISSAGLVMLVVAEGTSCRCKVYLR